MSKKFLSFGFPETTKKQIDAMPPEMQLKFYKAVTDYGMYGIEPQGFSDMERLIWIPMADLLDNGKEARGGAPAGNKNAQKNNQNNVDFEKTTKTTQNNQNNVVFDKTTETTLNKYKDKPKDNVKENLNANANSSDCARIDRLSPESFKDFQEDLYETIQKHNETAPNERKMPVSDSFLTFTMLEARDLLATPGMKESPPDKVKAALDNFLLTARSDTWQTAFTWRTFCNHWLEYAPDYFAMRPHLNAAPNTDDATKRPENAFYIKHKDDPDFKGDLFRKHAAEWLAGGRPEGAFYLDLQKKWEEEDAG